MSYYIYNTNKKKYKMPENVQNAKNSFNKL